MRRPCHGTPPHSTQLSPQGFALQLEPRPSPPMGERDESSALDAESGRADPARLRDVDHDAVGAVVLHLDVAVLVLPIPDSEGLVDVMARLRARRGQPLGDGLEAFDLEADVMDAAEALAALDSGHRVVLEIQDGQIEVAVAEIVAAGVGTVDLADLFHPEHVDVELGGLVHVLGRQRDVLDLGHEISPVGMSFRYPARSILATWLFRHSPRETNPGRLRQMFSVCLMIASTGASMSNGSAT